MSRLARWIDAAFGLPATVARALSALVLLALLCLVAVLVLPLLHWGLCTWSFFVNPDSRRAPASEQLPELAAAWIRERVRAALRGR